MAVNFVFFSPALKNIAPVAEKPDRCPAILGNGIRTFIYTKTLSMQAVQMLQPSVVEGERDQKVENGPKTRAAEKPVCVLGKIPLFQEFVRLPRTVNGRCNTLSVAIDVVDRPDIGSWKGFTVVENKMVDSESAQDKLCLRVHA
ncbi:MAG: hypothetical protein ABSF90_06185 [Syntrophobacteraceae bacterium]